MKLAGLALIALAFASGCERASHADSRPHAAVVIAPGPSLFPLQLSLTDDRGGSLSLDSRSGHPVIISMFYGSCPVACPMIVSNIQRIEAALPEAVRADTRVILVSFDAEHDTPKALSAIADLRRVDRSRWTFAAAPDDDARQLAAVLGVQYRKLAEGGFSHNSVITVLDGEGRPVARVDDPNADIDPMAATIIELSKNRSAPSKYR